VKFKDWREREIGDLQNAYRLISGGLRSNSFAQTGKLRALMRKWFLDT